MSHIHSPARFIRERVFRVTTQEAFAEMLGYRQATISRFENGSERISRGAQDRIRELAVARNIPWNDSWFFEVPSEDRAA